MNVNSGCFFSFEGAGEILWQYILETGNVKKAIRIMTAANRKIRQMISSSVTEFVSVLLQEKLLVATDTAATFNGITETEEKLKALALNFSPPKMNKYTHSEDILFFVSCYFSKEKNWPESIDNSGLIGAY